MPLTAGTNSNVSLEEANAYFADRPRRAVLWLEATDPDREEALIYATEHLEQRRWKGEPLEWDQPLHFPARYYDGYGNMYEDTPQAIRHATCELALANLESSLAAAPAAGPAVEGVKVGPIEVRFGGELKPTERENRWVERLIAPWLRFSPMSTSRY